MSPARSKTLPASTKPTTVEIPAEQLPVAARSSALKNIIAIAAVRQPVVIQDLLGAETIESGIPGR